MKAAEGVGQQRKKLFDLYDEVLLDGFLKACIRKRVNSITNRDITFMVDGEEIEEIKKLTKTSFFRNFITELMNSKFYGHSLIEMNWPSMGGELKGWTKLVDRRHVKPRFGIVTVQSHDLHGVDYREEPWSRVSIEAGEDEEMGDLLEVAQYVLSLIHI